MVLINDNSKVLKIGDPIPHFSLPATDGLTVHSREIKDPVLVVIFTCNHCPYAQAYEDRTQAVRKICKREKAKKDFSLVDQITRAARSVSLNIAEGNDSLSVREFIQSLGLAKRSAAEVRACLYEALDETYITSEEFSSLAKQTKKISAMLAGLIRYLQTLDHDRKRIIPHSPILISRKPANEQTRKP